MLHQPSKKHTWAPGIIFTKTTRNENTNVKKAIKHGFYGFSIFIAYSIAFMIISPVLTSDLKLVFALYIGSGFLVGMILGILDNRKYNKIRKYAQSDRIEDNIKAYKYIFNNYKHIRLISIKSIQKSCNQQPGKFLKYLDKGPEKVISDLFLFLSENKTIAQRHAIMCLMWLSRDYAQHFIQYRNVIASLIESNDSSIQCSATIILGNIGKYDSDRTDQYVKSITPAVKDQDAEVRQSAAVALGKLPSPHSLNILKHLSQDSDPNVRKKASLSIKSL